MQWTGDLIVVFVGACITLALMIINIILAARTGKTSDRVTFVLYSIAIVTVLCNVARLYGTTTKTIMAANIIALLCILVSLYRFIEERKLIAKESKG